jgi:ketosteroid isomerase-like protein
MSQENVALVADTIEKWNGGELFVPAAYDPEIEWLPQRIGTEGAYRGLEGMRRFAEDTRELFELFELRYELEDLGERVLAWGTVHFRARQSGLESEVPFAGVVSFRDGRILRWEDLGSKEAALEAAGVA